MRSRRRPPGPGLFPEGALRLRRTGEARLRDLAGLQPAHTSLQDRIKAEDRKTMRKLRRWGTELGEQFGLRYTALEAESEGVTDWYGVCYEDGVIRIRLRHARNGRLLKESSLVDTLCHELAHLRHLNHGPGFRKLYQRILERARGQGIYNPSSQDRRPRQSSLFDSDGAGCGTER